MSYRMRSRSRRIMPQYLHARANGQPVDGCECDNCSQQRNFDHYERMGDVFGLTEDDLQPVEPKQPHTHKQ